MRCIFCNSKKVAQLSPHMFRCNACGAHFDDDPEEGGDYSDDPVRSAVAREARDNARRLRRRPAPRPDFTRGKRFR